jgi:hypothetical protein
MGFLRKSVQTGNDLINYTYYIFFELIFFGEDIKCLIIRRKDPVNLYYWWQNNVSLNSLFGREAFKIISKVNNKPSLKQAFPFREVERIYNI